MIISFSDKIRLLELYYSYFLFNYTAVQERWNRLRLQLIALGFLLRIRLLRNQVSPQSRGDR